MANNTFKIILTLRVSASANRIIELTESNKIYRSFPGNIYNTEICISIYHFIISSQFQDNDKHTLS